MEETLDNKTLLDSTEEELEEAGLDVTSEETMEMLKKAAIEVVKEKDPLISEKIEELKKKHKNVYLYVFDSEEYYIVKPLYRNEFRIIKGKNLKSFEEEDEIFRMCVLYPKIDNLDTLKSGSVRVLSEVIQYFSNFGDTNPVIEL